MWPDFVHSITHKRCVFIYQNYLWLFSRLFLLCRFVYNVQCAHSRPQFVHRAPRAQSTYMDFGKSRKTLDVNLQSDRSPIAGSNQKWIIHCCIVCCGTDSHCAPYTARINSFVDNNDDKNGAVPRLYRAAPFIQFDKWKLYLKLIGIPKYPYFLLWTVCSACNVFVAILYENVLFSISICTDSETET